MQRCKVIVRMGVGQGALTTVQKENVSPAEIAILTAIHGEGSVTDIQPTNQCKTPHAAERSRLSTTYGHHVLDRIFPGEFTKLPVTLADIAHLMGEVPDEELPDEEGGSEDGPDLSGDKQDDSDKQPAEEDEDDKALRELIAGAETKDDLREIAKQNEVSLTDTADRMDAMRNTIIKELFGKR